MIYVDWQPGRTVEPPVYVDANVLVGATVRGHRLYRVCATVVGELLSKQSRIFVSPLSVQESIWAIVRISYCELARQRPSAHFSQDIYKRWCERIFAAHGSRIMAVSTMLQDLSQAGLPVEVIPKTDILWNRTLNMAPSYMRQCKLTPADAFHLALAQTHARTFITADSDFKVVGEGSLVGELVVLHLVP